MVLGVALIGLGGVNLVFLMVSPKFISFLPMLPDPIPYSESESLSLQQCLFQLASYFLIASSSLSIFSLNCIKDFFMGLGFFPPFLAAWKSIFPFRLSRTCYNPWCYSWYMHPHASCRGCNASRCKLSWEPCPCTWYQVPCFPCHFFVGLCVESFLGTFTLNTLERQEKQTHVHGNHPFLV